jgi:two-component system sensor kinase FixL
MTPVGGAANVARRGGVLGGLLAPIRVALALIHRRAVRSAWRDAARISELTCAGATADLAATLVGEMGSPITSLLVNLGSARRLLARGDLVELSEVMAAVDEARTAGEKVAHTVQDLWAIQGTGRWEPVDLNDAAREAVRLVQGRADAEGVSLGVELDERLPSLRGDAAQIVQVALSLVLRAVDAAVASSKAAVSVRTLLSNEGIELLVANSGSGISESDRTSLFERPFPVTCRNLGLGNRLGVVRFIVEAHAGRIGAERPESGVLIRVVWPVPRSDAPVRPTSAS